MINHQKSETGASSSEAIGWEAFRNQVNEEPYAKDITKISHIGIHCDDLTLCQSGLFLYPKVERRAPRKSSNRFYLIWLTLLFEVSFCVRISLWTLVKAYIILTGSTSASDSSYRRGESLKILTLFIIISRLPRKRHHRVQVARRLSSSASLSGFPHSSVGSQVTCYWLLHLLCSLCSLCLRVWVPG